MENEKKVNCGLNCIPKNQPCYDKDGNFLGWFSRSVATALFVFCKNEKNKWCVLASERGKEAADFQGYWNCPCGYLDINETTKECCVRECLEETGVNIDGEYTKFIGFEDDPIKANRQNVTLRFCAIIKDKKCGDFTFSKAGNEGIEVGEIKWIPIDEINNYQWAFGHEERIKEIFKLWVNNHDFGWLFGRFINFFDKIIKKVS